MTYWFPESHILKHVRYCCATMHSSKMTGDEKFALLDKLHLTIRIKLGEYTSNQFYLAFRFHIKDISIYAKSHILSMRSTLFSLFASKNIKNETFHAWQNWENLGNWQFVHKKSWNCVLNLSPDKFLTEIH